ncbi:hypothetical protein Pst134EA_031248 [Puccinia striiformis f. sp. tritici]|uniref:uncharacterized protein n=1 Tax=Puccinia striiformis f. sp. tritici TaxID=168172 RepID=UPI002008DF9E|nr:uncharacterized protein Pst134EA_031248 [Puccinia striiformis f. sp. tritici]KAH9443411.1 hypothetical protein Pst134EA_031248 [Puccinia striiformis f. sp. tritici]
MVMYSGQLSNSILLKHISPAGLVATSPHQPIPEAYLAPQFLTFSRTTWSQDVDLGRINAGSLLDPSASLSRIKLAGFLFTIPVELECIIRLSNSWSNVSTQATLTTLRPLPRPTSMLMFDLALSPAPPLSRISDPVYQPWEDALEVVSKLISQITNEESKLGEVVKWKEFIVSELPVLSIDPLRSEIVEMRRARLVLAFLTHAFVHSLASSQNSSQETQVTIPLSLAVPFSEISLALDMPPVLTYADTVLYNWLLKEPALGFTVERNKSITYQRFSVTSEQGVTHGTFYWEIRPWFIGGRWKWEGIESDASNKCNIKEDTRQTSEERQWKVTELGGPSAGQSTLIHAIDVFLGVDHEPNLQEVSSGIQDEDTFMNRMSTYMPHHHRLFLQQLSRSCLTRRGHPNLIRSVVVNHQDQEFKSGPNNLKENYNLCIKALENLRKTHTKIVSPLFIICQKKLIATKSPTSLELLLIS